jgi:hypothetical protein
MTIQEKYQNTFSLEGAIKNAIEFEKELGCQALVTKNRETGRFAHYNGVFYMELVTPSSRLFKMREYLGYVESGKWTPYVA